MNEKEEIPYPCAWPSGYAKIWYEMPELKEKEITVKIQPNYIVKGGLTSDDIS